MRKRLTAADVCAVTGYSRDELHALLRVLPPYNLERPVPRVAREFAAKDLLVLSVTQILEDRYGVRRTAVGELGSFLQEVLAGPRQQGIEYGLQVTVRPASAWLIDPSVPTAGLTVLLTPIFEKIDRYLSSDPQMTLQFGPALVRRYA